MKIGVIGLGKLGLPLATVLAEKHQVVGVDLDKRAVSMINKGISSIDETGQEEQLENYPIRATTDYKELKDCKAIFIILPTPSEADGDFTDIYIRGALKELTKFKINPKLIVINSTVMPGTCKELQKKYKKNIVYNPFFIALGSVIRDIKKPDFLLIGADKKRNTDLLLKIYNGLIDAKFTATKSLINAEIAKIALNAYVTMKINFANHLGELCESIPEANVDEVTMTIGHDRRIGHAYLKSGMPFGGPCFPRDNKAFGNVCSKFGVDPTMHHLVDEQNKGSQIYRILDICKEMLGEFKDKHITILGSAYKIDTSHLVESPSVWLKTKLEWTGVRVNLIDTTAEVSDLPKTDLVIIALPNATPEIISKKEIIKCMKSPKVLDCWRCRPDLIYKKIKYRALGVNEQYSYSD